ncbi:MAG TPA: sulfotransferase, partial [Alphaproteobacteria bacterium]|nr:sulfotransferase [Alphaproteobacteria bacterium]
MMERAAYSGLDRLLHRVAFDEVFHGIALQRALAELEDGLVARKIEAVAPSAPPVFVTALPRAGTTLVLNLLARVPGFASHTYRDMPFLLAPLLWGRLSRPFRKSASEAERAHGDGVMVGYDSPEAFEEVLWLAFWRDKYHADRIEPWTADDRDPEFESFFNRHIAKLLAARAAERDGPPPNRYLSKNNANIARLGLLPEL